MRCRRRKNGRHWLTWRELQPGATAIVKHLQRSDCPIAGKPPVEAKLCGTVVPGGKRHARCRPVGQRGTCRQQACAQKQNGSSEHGSIQNEDTPGIGASRYLAQAPFLPTDGRLRAVRFVSLTASKKTFRVNALYKTTQKKKTRAAGCFCLPHASGTTVAMAMACWPATAGQQAWRLLGLHEFAGLKRRCFERSDGWPVARQRVIKCFTEHSAYTRVVVNAKAPAVLVD